MPNAIEIKNLSKKYDLYQKNWHVLFNVLPHLLRTFFLKERKKEMWVFKDLSLTIGRGERIGIIGENGTGKSTLLKVIAGYISKSSGEVKIYGKVHSLLNMGAGFYHGLDAIANIRAYFNLYNTKLTDEIIEDILDFSELGDYAYQPLKSYSSGMFARYAFAVMTAIQPEILIVDEILGAGDAYFTGKCIERVNKLCSSKGMTLLLVSHDMTSIQHMCKKAIWLHKGEVKSSGASLEVIKDYLAYMRQKQNLRLKAKDKKIPRELSTTTDESQALFRFVYHKDTLTNEDPQIKIYMLNASIGNFPLDEVKIGKVLDNDNKQNIYILDAKGKMGWSSPEQDDQGYYRNCYSSRAKYNHSPFIIHFPENLRDYHETVQLEITYKSNVSFNLDYYDEENNEYCNVIALPETNGAVNVSKLTYNLAQKALVSDETAKTQELTQTTQESHEDIENIDDSFVQYIRDKDQYGTLEMIITNVQILDIHQQDVRVLEVEQSYTIRLSYESFYDLSNPVFVFCVYTPDGLCAAQLVQQGKHISLDKVGIQKGHIDFYIPKLFLGPKDYIASVAIFKKMNETKIEPESYHVLDRCIHFKVEDPCYTYERGICVQPFISKAVA